MLEISTLISYAAPQQACASKGDQDGEVQSVDNNPELYRHAGGRIPVPLA
jgi:hypothetical protein